MLHQIIGFAGQPMSLREQRLFQRLPAARIGIDHTPDRQTRFHLRSTTEPEDEQADEDENEGDEESMMIVMSDE